LRLKTAVSCSSRRSAGRRVPRSWTDRRQRTQT